MKREPEINDELVQDMGNVSMPTTAIQALVRAGRAKFTRQFVEKQQRFNALSWDVRELNDRPAIKHRTHLCFTRYGTTDQALPRAYAEVVKSWLVLEGKSIDSILLPKTLLDRVDRLQAEKRAVRSRPKRVKSDKGA